MTTLFFKKPRQLAMAAKYRNFTKTEKEKVKPKKKF